MNQAKIKFPARFVEPMLYVPVKELPQGPAWEYELKLDGYRALGLKSGGGVYFLVMAKTFQAASPT